MANIEHKNIADANLHEPKGAASATAGAIIACNGSGGTATTNNGSTPVNLYDNELRRPKIKDYSETVNAIGATTSTEDVDLELGNAVTATLSVATTTFTFSNPPATGTQGSFTMILTQDGTGSRLVTWPASVKWADGGTAPTLSTAASAVDILGFLTVDAGTTWYGFLGGVNFT